MFPNYLFDVYSGANALFNASSGAVGMKNMIFLIVVSIWVLIEVIGLLKSLFTVHIDLQEDKYLKDYKISELKKDTVERVIEISDYINNYNNLELRSKVVKQIKDEFDIIDSDIDLEEIIKKIKLESDNINFTNRPYNKDLVEKMSAGEEKETNIVFVNTIKSLYED